MSEIRLDAPTEFKVIRTDDGRLHCEGFFCRDGVMEYRQPDGSLIRELRRPETNANPKTVESFKLLPLVVEHPPVGLLNSKNYKNFTVGFTDSSAHYDSANGVIKGLVSFFDSDAISKIESKEKEQLSAGYICDVKEGKGVWNGQEYDREQINVRANHLALTARGRAGADVRLRLDSEAGIGMALSLETDSKENIKKNRMAKINLDNVEYADIPEGLAYIIGTKVTELKEVKEKFDSLQARLDSFGVEIKKLEESKKNDESVISQLKESLNAADSILASLGYERNDSGQYGKKKSPILKGETEEVLEEDPEAVETPKKKAKKTEKMDCDSVETDEKVETVVTEAPQPEVKKDSLPDLLAAWKEADDLLPDFSKAHFDSEFSVADIKRTVLTQVEPDLDLSTKSDEYVAGVFERVKTTRKDSSLSDYTQKLDTALKTNNRMNGGDNGLQGWQQQRAEAYKKPLAMSKNSLGAK